MQIKAAGFIARLEREWRFLEPERLVIAPPSMATPEVQPFSEIAVKRLKVGRVD